MLLKLFRQSTPGVIILLGFILGILWISAFLDPQAPLPAPYETNPMPLYAIIKYLAGRSALTGTLFSFLMVILMTILLTGFNTSVFFINERTFLPGFFYILLSALFPHMQVLNPLLPAAVFLMIALMRIMSTYRKQGTAYSFFDAGMLIAAGSLIYANLIWFGILLIAGVILLRPKIISETGISLLGLLTPYILIIGIYYVAGRDPLIFLSDFYFNLFGTVQVSHLSRLSIVLMIFGGIMIFTALAFLLMRISSQKIKARKTFYLLLWILFISILVYLFLPSVSVEIIWIAGIPVSYLLAHYFVFVRGKIMPEILFTGILILILLVQFFYIF